MKIRTSSLDWETGLNPKTVKIKRLPVEPCPCGGKFIRTRGENQVCCLVCINLGLHGVPTKCNTLPGQVLGIMKEKSLETIP